MLAMKLELLKIGKVVLICEARQTGKQITPLCAGQAIPKLPIHISKLYSDRPNNILKILDSSHILYTKYY